MKREKREWKRGRKRKIEEEIESEGEGRKWEWIEEEKNRKWRNGMGEKEDLAMPATGQTISEMRFFLQNRTYNSVISSNNAADLSIAVPVRNKLKMGLDLYYKKAKCSLISLI